MHLLLFCSASTFYQILIFLFLLFTYFHCFLSIRTKFLPPARLKIERAAALWLVSDMHRLPLSPRSQGKNVIATRNTRRRVVVKCSDCLQRARSLACLSIHRLSLHFAHSEPIRCIWCKLAIEIPTLKYLSIVDFCSRLFITTEVGITRVI